ncbi:MAG TPA: hypothetical protein ENG69_03130 [Candidatus Korarchaeota archaeon]|nr:hypothetical protein [Candidatus Korarchaeota archaeon]
MYAEPRDAARVASALWKEVSRSKKGCADWEKLISLAYKASPADTLLSRIPLLRRLLLRRQVTRERPVNHDWWFEFGRQLYMCNPDLAARLLTDLRNLDLPAESLFMGIFTSIVNGKQARRAVELANRRDPRAIGSRVVERAIRLAAGACRRVDPLIMSELISRLNRLKICGEVPSEPSLLLARVGWPYGVALSVLMKLSSEADALEKAKRLREVASSTFSNWPSLVWIFLPKIARERSFSWSQAAILDAVVASGGWPIARSVARRLGWASEERASHLEKNGFLLIAAVLKVVLAEQQENPRVRATLLLEAGNLVSRKGMVALAGSLYAEAAETLRPQVANGAPVFEQYHRALERTAMALMDAGLHHRAFRYWAELALSCAGLRESGLEIPGVLEREAEACFWMGEILSGRAPHESAIWYLRASKKYKELGATWMSAEAKKRASIEFLTAGDTEAATDAVRDLEISDPWTARLLRRVPPAGDRKMFFH